MEIQSRSPLSSDPRTVRDQQARLIRDLAPLASVLGHDPSPTVIKKDLLNVNVEADRLVGVCRFVRDQLGFELLTCISGVDLLDHLEVIYHLRSFARRQMLQLRVQLPTEHPGVESLVSLWPSANWL